ncbi:eEF1A lysine and N-terminal methyltransferase isoform X2 [Carettochelys insculpta]|uniref:eEF1A lysine and N-terminal methyltransferase isoform X2 n=1 Tax=Carettochelys insculpta TaxID=44489 RepID=UPI003EB9F0BD
MALLPRSAREFGSAQYWERFFRQRGPRAFEWYGGYPQLCAALHKYVRPRDKVLVVGCGNSELSEQMYDVGFQDIVNVDISEVVINQMRERNTHKRPKMSYLLMDMLQMDFQDSRFQVVLDKGTLDAILVDEEEATLERVDRMFAEISRVLQVGGRYLCISLAQAHVVKKAVDYFSREGWMVRIHQLSVSEDEVDHQQFVLPVFIYVMTKFKKIPGAVLQILEICTEEKDKPVRVESVEQLVEAVKERQMYAVLRSQLNKSPSTGQVSLDLCDADSGKPRYTLHVVDSPAVKASRDNHFAIFISQKKRRKDKKKQVSSSPEASRPSAGQAVDRSYLCCEHHKAMVAGLALLRNPELLPGAQLSVLVIGLGGGSLPLFIHEYFRQARVETVEIDPAMLEVATRWFGFSQGDRMTVHLSDGLAHVANLAAAEAPAQYNAVMFDVDSKDPSLGMSCPPPAFVEKSFLEKVRTILVPDGVFVLNLVCRDSLLKDSVLATLKEVFPLVYARRIEGEVNEILFSQLHPEGKLAAPELLETARALEMTLRRPGQAWDSSCVLADVLAAVQIV